MLSTLEQMVRQFAEFPQVVDDRRVCAEHQRLQRHLPVGNVVLLAVDKRRLRRRVRERLALAAAPRAEPVVRQQRVDVDVVAHVGEVALACHEDELAMIPATSAENTNTAVLYMLQGWYTHTRTHPFNCPFSGTTQASQYEKGKTNLDYTEARDNKWQWHQLGHMQVCTSLQTDNHASTPPLKFFTGRMPFLLPNRQRQSIEGIAGLVTM